MAPVTLDIFVSGAGADEPLEPVVETPCGGGCAETTAILNLGKGAVGSPFPHPTPQGHWGPQKPVPMEPVLMESVPI